MIAVIRTTHGTYNIFGTREDDFVIQGNLTEDELQELKDQIDEALEA